MGLTVEQQVGKFLQDGNRPFNVQLVVDGLQKFGIKKGQVQKALDSLADQEKVTVKVTWEAGGAAINCAPGIPTRPILGISLKSVELRGRSLEKSRYTFQSRILVLKSRQK